MDPASLTLESATAFTAALALFLSRLDTHHKRITEQPDIRAGLWKLSFEVTEWLHAAEETDGLIQLWARGEVDDDRMAQTIHYASKPITLQMMVSDTVFKMMVHEDFLRTDETRYQHWREGRVQGWKGLQNLLRIYAPEVSEALMQAMEQRRALVERLIADLPNLRACGPEFMRAVAMRLHLAHEELDRAAELLDEFIRNHFPRET